MTHIKKYLQITMIMLAFIGLSINGFAQTYYAEDFSTDPDFVSYSETHAYWDNTNKNYYVNTFDNATYQYWAHSPVFTQVDASKDLLIEFDVVWENIDWGTYPKIIFTDDEPTEMSTPYSLQIQMNWSMGHTKSIGITEGTNTYHSEVNGPAASGMWYHITIDYLASTNKANIIISETVSGNIYYQVDNVDFTLNTFKWIGLGFYDGGTQYGDEWSPIRIDNVLIKKQGFTIYTDANYGQLNSSVEIPVTEMSELTADDGIYSYQFVYSFDDTKLQYTGYDLTGLISEGGTVEVNTDTPGELTISWMRATPLVGTGGLINLQFNAIAEGTSDLTITNFKYNETDVTDVTNGDITIVTPTTADVTYSTDVILPGTELVITATFNRAINDSPVTQIELTGANTLSATNMTKVSETVYNYTYTVAEGEGIVNVILSVGIDEYGFEIENTPTTGATFEILSLTYGDITNNGEVTAYDAALALMYSVGVDPMPEIAPLPWELWRILTADVDGSDDITATDAGLILQYSVGLIDIFPVESGDKSGQKESDIIVEIVDNEFVFTTLDELLGFNLYVTNNSNAILGEPEFLDPNMLSATQIEGEIYNLGTCIAISPASGTQLLKIPFTGELTGELIFDMKVNNTDKSVTFGTTEISETNTKSISVYPNPAIDKIQITSSVSLDNSTIEIYTILGKLVNSISANNNNEINISDLPNGIYIIKINSETVNFTERIIKE